ncbi:MAG: glutathione S-transferase family protein [Pseudomonadota bacterium]
MIKLYHAPRTRSMRIIWLLEELGIPYALETVEFIPPAQGFFAQQTPFGKIPVIEDGDTVMFESGAIIEYILERYGDDRLSPPIGSPLRGQFLQWMHFTEGTAATPISTFIWHMLYKQDADKFPEVLEEARNRAHVGFKLVEESLKGKDYLLGDEFSAADIMLVFTLTVAGMFGLLDERYPNIAAYMQKMEPRPAFQKARAMALPSS